MTLKEIYRLALARGLTAKQAGSEFNVRWESLHKVGSKHKLPKLMSEFENSDRQQIAKMSDDELLSYMKSLSEKGAEETSEFKYCSDEATKRFK